MKIELFLLTAFLLPFTSAAKTVADFINEHPEIKSKPVIKAAIQQGAIGNAGMDAVSNGATNQSLGTDVQNLLKDNGYEYAVAALRDLASSTCDEPSLADIYGLKDKDCAIIKKVDSEIE